MPEELRMNVEFTHPETGELQRANVSPFHPSTVRHSHRPAEAEIRLHTASQ